MRKTKVSKTKKVLQEIESTNTQEIETPQETEYIGTTDTSESNIKDLLDIIDGRTTIKSFIVIVTKGEGFIVVRKGVSFGNIKIKFYPNFEFWGMSDEKLLALNSEGKLVRREYGRCYMDVEKVKQLLNELRVSSVRPSPKVSRWKGGGMEN